MLIALGRLQNGESASAPPVKRSLDRITEIGEIAGDPSMRAMPLALIGLSQVFAGPVREGVAKLEEALPLIEGRQDSIGAAFARGALSIGYATLGEFDKAITVAKLRGARERKRRETGKCEGRKSIAETQPDVVTILDDENRAASRRGHRVDVCRYSSLDLGHLSHT